MSTPTSRLVRMPAGTTRYLELAVTYSDEWSVEADRGDPLRAADVESATFLLKRRLADGDAEAKVAKATGDGITVEDGLVTVLLEPADTADLQGEYAGTLRLFMADGAVQDFEDADYDGVPYVTLQITQGAVEATA